MANKHAILHWVAGLIFAVIAILHLVRLFKGWPAIIGTLEIPLFASGIAFVVAGILSFLLFKN